MSADYNNPELTKIGGYVETEPDDLGHDPIIKPEAPETPKAPSAKPKAAAKLRGRPATRKKIPNTEEKPNTPVTAETKRKPRKPVGLRTPVKKTETRAGYHRRWVNDVEDRLQVFEEGGYEVVMDKEGSPKTRRAGAGRRQVLMEIPQDLYDEDQKVKYAKWNKDCQERLKPREDVAGFYQPKIGPR